MRGSKSIRSFQRKLLSWYDRHKRDLPWRAQRPDPYHVLVSEAMLQQTQVATVIPYYRRFLERFPTIQKLAGSDEQDVLRLWQGLGYYSRARNLRAAARAVMNDHGGRLPSSADELIRLPGVGRYTAGAVASIAFDQRAPILDGNVVRVLCRLDAITTDPRDRSTQEKLWSRAEEILPTKRVGDFNSALMELGATVCTPRGPKCLMCPVQAHCEALAEGLQEKIPAPRAAKPTPLEHRWTFCIGDDGRWLIEQRPPRGRWAGLWQFLTIEAHKSRSPAQAIHSRCAIRTSQPKRIGEVTHALTHRRYRFDVFACHLLSGSDIGERRWATLAGLDAFPLSRPQLRIAAMLNATPSPVCPTT